MIALLLPLILGIFSGTITGLIPGIHINLVAISLLSLSFIQNLPPTPLLVFIIAMAITHTFLDFIPSIFLGAPSEDTSLSALPGHELLLKGQGHNALKLTLIGSTIAILSLIIILPVFIFFIPKIYPTLQRMMGFLLIWVAFLLILNEKQKLKASIIFILSGFLGLASLNLDVNQSLLPLLTGLFATSTLIHSVQVKTVLPKQKIEKLHISKFHIIKPTIATIIISPICSLFPGLGSSQAAIIASEVSGKTTREQFLILLGSINTIVMSVSFVTLILFQKVRTGAAFAINQITGLTFEHLTLILTTTILTTLISIPIALQVSKTFSKNIHKIPYTTISKTTLIFLTIIITYISGVIGLLILIVSTLLGLTCIEFGTRRSFLMGAILIPTIIFYLPF